MARFRIRLAGVCQRLHPIGTEMAKPAAQFAPSRQQPCFGEERHRERPHPPLAEAALRIDIVHLHAMSVADGPAQSRQPRFRRRAAPIRHQQAAGFHLQAQRRRQQAGDAVHRRAGRRGQFRVRVCGHPARTEHHRLQFVLGEHHRRQHEAWPQSVADAGLAVDFSALFAQGFDVAVHRAQAHAQTLGQVGAARTAVPAVQFVDEAQQAGRSGAHAAQCAARRQAPGRWSCRRRHQLMPMSVAPTYNPTA